MTSTVEIDWTAAETLAGRLGANTRQLVAERCPPAIAVWAMTMARQYDVSEHNAARAASYAELAAIVDPLSGDDDPAS